MNSKLHNRTIYIGRSEAGSKLVVAVTDGNGYKQKTIGDIGSVPGCVSRWKPDVQKAHCKIEISGEGSMVITNMVDANVTKVNGVSIVAKALKADDIVLLGRDDYAVSISDTLSTIESLLVMGEVSNNEPDEVVKLADTTPLAAIWDEYHSKLHEIHIKQRRTQNYRILYLPLGLLISIIVGFLPSNQEASNQEFQLLFLIPLCFAIFSAYKVFTDKSMEEKEKLSEWMQDNYVYPCCKNYAGLNSYKIIQQKKQCPHCKAKLKHKED